MIPLRKAHFHHAGALAALLLGVVGARATTAVWTNADDRNPRDEHGVLTAAYWSFGYVPPDEHGNGEHIGNWSGLAYPGSVSGIDDAYLSSPGDTQCNVQVALNSLTLTASGALMMNGGSSLDVASTVMDSPGISVGGGGGAFPIYTNSNTFRKTSGVGACSLDEMLVFNSVAGSQIIVDGGSLQLPGLFGLIESTKFDPAAGTSITLLTPVSDGVAIFQGTLTNGTRGGNVILSGGLMAGTQRHIQNPQPCTLAFTGDVFQWTGGIIGSYQQGAVFTNTGVVNLNGPVPKGTDADFTNRNLMIQSGTGIFNIGEANSGGSLTNAAGATYDLQSDADIGQGTYPFNNAGLFKKSGGTGTSAFGQDMNFNHQGGTVEVDSGTLLLPDNGTSTGAIFKPVAATTLIDIGGNGSFTGTYTGTGAGHVQYSHGNLTAPGAGVTFNFPGAMFQWTGGAMGTYQRGNSISNAGTISLLGASEKVNYADFTNHGTMLQSGAGNFDNNHGTIINAADGVFALQSDSGITGAFSPLTNAGVLEKTGGSGTSTIESNGFTNTGSVVVRSGTLALINFQFPGGKLAGGSWEVDDGAALTIDPNSGGVVTNQGDVTLGGVNSVFAPFNSLADNQGRFALDGLRVFTTAGALASSGTLDIGAGSTLRVMGALTLSDTSSTEFGVGGASHSGAHSAGVVTVNGAPALAGQLVLRLTPDVVLPSADDSIVLLSATAPLSGSFSNAANNALVSAGNGITFHVHYGPTSPYGASSVVIDGINLPAPSLHSFSPASGNAGTAVAINGTNFLAPISVVFSNGRTATVDSFTSTRINVHVPAGTSTGPIKVTAAGGSVTTTANFKSTGVQPPVITSAATATGKAGTAFSYQITASNSPASYGAANVPPGLSVNQSTGKISGTPTMAGTYTTTISASNSGGSGSAKLTVTITAPPVVSSAATATATTGKAFTYQITASNSPASYGAANLPSGLSINQATGLISGTPTVAGTFTPTIAAFNSAGSGSKKITLTVKLGAPVITSATTASATHGKAFSYQITASSSPTSYGAASLPTGLTINQTTGKISGTPTKAGTYSVTVAAFNSSGSGSAKLALTVK